MSVLIHRRNHASKDEDAKMEARLNEISRKLDALGGGHEPKARTR